MAKRFKQVVFTLLALSAFSGAAEAHTGHGATMGFAAGFLHPLSGLDHLLAMVTVGLLAARMGGKALWAVPAALLIIGNRQRAFRSVQGRG